MTLLLLYPLSLSVIMKMFYVVGSGAPKWVFHASVVQIKVNITIVRKVHENRLSSYFNVQLLQKICIVQREEN
jgi:hypothetical protein